MSRPLPLAGVRVLEIAQNIAGPYAAEILGRLGAEVIKVERPEGGDDCRGWGPPFFEGTATTFHACNHGKKGVTLDLKDPAAIAWIKEQVLQSDVFIQNLRPGVVDELGLGPDTLRAINPRLIYTSLWAFGHVGPMKFKPGYEPMIQAFSGIFSVNGTADGPPSRVGMQILDLGTGVWAALATIAALFQRQSSGQGCTVDASLLETAFGWLGMLMAGFGVSGEQPVRHRTGNPRVVVFQAFEAQDGEIVVAAANDRLFAKLVRELGRPEWASDPRFATNALRYKNKPDLLPEMSEIFRTQTVAQWVDRLEAAGVPCSPIHDFEQAQSQPQTEALGIFQELPGSGLRIVGLPFSLDGERPAPGHAAPALGEHSVELGVPPLGAQT